MHAPCTWVQGAYVYISFVTIYCNIIAYIEFLPTCLTWRFLPRFIALVVAKGKDWNHLMLLFLAILLELHPEKVVQSFLDLFWLQLKTLPNLVPCYFLRLTGFIISKNPLSWWTSTLSTCLPLFLFWKHSCLTPTCTQELFLMGHQVSIGF